MTIKKKFENTFNYALLFLLGVLITTNGFTLWQYSQLSKDVDNVKTDIITIVTQYNNLVTRLQSSEILNPSLPATPPTQ